MALRNLLYLYTKSHKAEAIVLTHYRLIMDDNTNDKIHPKNCISVSSRIVGIPVLRHVIPLRYVECIGRRKVTC